MPDDITVSKPRPVRTPRPATGRLQPLSSIKPKIPRKAKPASATAAKSGSTTTLTCPNTSCTDPRLEQHSGQLVCITCGTVVNDANIVSEIQFGETANGAAVVQGAFIGADESHARSNIPGGNRLGLNTDSREKSDGEGRREIGDIAAALNIHQSTQTAAFNIWRLCTAANFIQGRRVNQVAAVCLYIACRKMEKENRWMLIDFSDLIHVNVFKLGHVFTAMLKALGSIGGVPNIMIENLVYRFVEKLDFGEKKVKVAGDAVRIVQRMKKDWMSVGRRPAGICGAGVILAARMNNFRRSVREVVYVAKVTDLTIQKRLEEFKITASSSLTVDEFRVVELEREHDPPAFYEDRTSKKRKRGGQAVNSEDSVDEPEEALGPPDAFKAPSSERRVDSEGFAIPAPPSSSGLVDPQLTTTKSGGSSSGTDSAESSSNSAPKKKRGRPKKNAKEQAPTLADPEEEAALEVEITEMVNDPTSRINAVASTTPSTLADEDTSDELEIAFVRSLEAAEDVTARPRPPSKIPDTPIIPDDEFADDPDIENCLLTEQEREIKERIWLHENKDYLRKQQSKKLKEQMEQQKGGRVIKRRKRVKKGQIGADGEHTSGASTPQEAARMMLKRRGFSTRINYDAVERLLGRSGPSSSDSNNTDGSGNSVHGSEGDAISTSGEVVLNGRQTRNLLRAPAAVGGADDVGEIVSQLSVADGDEFEERGMQFAVGEAIDDVMSEEDEVDYVEEEDDPDAGEFD